jgi:transposase
MTTKILVLTDALGNLVRFTLLPGQRYDTVGVAPLIEGIAFDGLIADKAFDADWIIAALNERGARIVISQRPQRTNPLPIDAEIYKWRRLIENFLLQAQGVQTHRHARRQDRHQLRRHDPTRRRRDQFAMNLNRP